MDRANLFEAKPWGSSGGPVGSLQCRSTYGDVCGRSEPLHRGDSDGACDGAILSCSKSLRSFDYTSGRWTGALLTRCGVRRSIVCVMPMAHGRVVLHKRRAVVRCHEMNDLSRTVPPPTPAQAQLELNQSDRAWLARHRRAASSPRRRRKKRQWVLRKWSKVRTGWSTTRAAWCNGLTKRTKGKRTMLHGPDHVAR